MPDAINQQDTENTEPLTVFPEPRTESVTDKLEAMHNLQEMMGLMQERAECLRVNEL